MTGVLLQRRNLETDMQSKDNVKRHREEVAEHTPEKEAGTAISFSASGGTNHPDP